MEFVRPERLWLKTHPQFNERWVQDRIEEDPAILGLGDLILKDKERIQPHAGRLDLLLQDAENSRRYEVEIQLGRTDESHIIRTLEYWDVERKRYPQYDHCAVIVAEDITSRFLNIIGLFNGHIPLIAVQMSALRIGDKVALLFTTVLDELTLALEEEEDEEVADRAYWETKRGTPETVGLADQICEMVRDFAPDAQLRYTKSYIVFSISAQPNNFILLRPRKSYLRLEARLEESDELDNKLTEAGLESTDYDKRRGRYRFNLSKSDIQTKRPALSELLRIAYENSK